MGDSKIEKRQIILVILAVLFVVGLFVGFLIFTAPTGHYPVADIDSGWNVSINDGEHTYSDITLSKTKFSMMEKGDTMVLERVLPNETIRHPVLCFYSIHCYVKAYLEGELFYEYGHENWSVESLPGYGYQVTQLPDNYEGKTLRLEYSVVENQAFEGLQKPSIMNGTYRTQNMMSANRVNLIVCMFLVIVGFLGMVVSALMLLKGSLFRKLFWISLFSCVVGLWSMCNNETMSIFVMNISEKSYVEYLCFYLMCIPFLLYFYDRVNVPGLAKWLKVYYAIVCIGQLLMFVIVNIAHYTNWFHYPACVPVVHIFLVLSFLFFVLLLVAERRLYHKTEWRIAIGFGIAALIAMIEVIRFNIQKYFTGFLDNKYNSALALGVLFVVGTMLLDLGVKIANAMEQNTRNKFLKQMAYMDDLTGLSNRRKCEEHLKELDESGEKNYTIINMDMNLLKAINDTFGHDVGDKALQMFADVLRMVFPSQANIYRMGGDEFAVIIPGVDEEKSQEYIRVMIDEMERRNMVEEEITLSTAYGCAYSYEGAQAHSVYKLADQRMYNCKKDMHLERV